MIATIRRVGGWWPMGLVALTTGYLWWHLLGTPGR